MASTPRTHHTPSARASSAREEPKAREAQEARHERAAARPDPSTLPQHTDPNVESTSLYEKENPPSPQTGPSSSQLNSMPGAAKDVHVADQEGPSQTPEKK